MTTIPGSKAKHCIVTDACRENRGDVGAVDEAPARLRKEALLYFGCHRESGHFFWVPGMNYARDAERTLPWKRVDGVLCPGAGPDPDFPTARMTRPEVQGEAALHHKDGWTALAFWDRSVDERGGCNSIFFAEGVYDFEAMKRLAQEHFPEVWKRFRFKVRLV